MIQPLRMDQCTLITRGGHRLIYAHPHNDALILKVPRPEIRERARTTKSFWRRNFGRFKHYNDSMREALEHVACYASDEAQPPFLQRFYGFIETDMGLASISRAERDENGNYALNLTQLIKQGKFDDTARAAFEEFVGQFISSDIVVGDLRTDNIVYAVAPGTGRMRFVIIDGIGDKNGIKICSYSRFYNRISKRKRINRLRETISHLLRQNAATKQDTGSVDGCALGSTAR